MSLHKQKVLITAGPTREYWDPVRFLSNGSSGAMGMALAREAARRGARVTLVLGPVPVRIASGRGLRVVQVESAREMDQAVQTHLPGTGVLLAAAAVSDFRPAVRSRQKLKGKPSDVTLRLVRNPDIVARAARPGRRRPPCVVGFALETERMIVHAREKLDRKNLDWVIANERSALGSSSASVTMLSSSGRRIRLPRMAKNRLARCIWNVLLREGIEK